MGRNNELRVTGGVFFRLCAVRFRREMEVEGAWELEAK